MEKYVIYPKDYLDLSEILSEKNVINSVNGAEYVVNKIEGHLLSPIDADADKNPCIINPNTLEQIFENGSGAYSNRKYNPNLRANYTRWTETFLSIPSNNWLDIDWTRTESLSQSGSYEFTTDEVIAEDSSFVAEFTINYTESRIHNLNDSTYNQSHKTCEGGVGGKYYFPIEPVEKTISNEGLPVKQSKSSTYYFPSGHTLTDDPPKHIDKVEVKVIEQTESYTKFRVSYDLRIWGLWNGENDWGSSRTKLNKDGRALYVNSIEIRVLGSVVDVKEVAFNYDNSGIHTERVYELETNELMQTELGEDDESKLSYKTAQEITNKYDTDRRIITFDLINPVKILFDDTNIYSNGVKENRYIDTNDVFDIYDEHNALMGTFKVIQSNPIWDGSYHKRITAILVD